MANYGSTVDTPMTVHVVDGQVVVLGPGPIGVAMTARAAEESGRRLIEAARLAAASEGVRDA